MNATMQQGRENSGTIFHGKRAYQSKHQSDTVIHTRDFIQRKIYPIIPSSFSIRTQAFSVSKKLSETNPARSVLTLSTVMSLPDGCWDSDSSLIEDSGIRTHSIQLTRVYNYPDIQ